MLPPLIGVTTSEVRLADKAAGEPGLTPADGDGARPQLPEGDPRSRRDARGDPTARRARLEPVLDGFDGLCLSGGPDVHPSAYGRDPHPALGPTWRDLDEAELAITREGDSRELPILGICRGAQVLNVARGGTLFQDLPDEVGGDVAHRQQGIGPGAAHSIEVRGESRLAAVLGSAKVDVNSYHHQAPRELGRGLRAVAFAPDGVVEGLEDPGREFAIGVQWHAEADSGLAENARLFAAFVEAARVARPGRRRETHDGSPARAAPRSRPRSR